MSDKRIIRDAFFALCQYQNPSLNKEQKKAALGHCWDILSSALHADCPPASRTNNRSYGQEKELP